MTSLDQTIHRSTLDVKTKVHDIELALDSATGDISDMQKLMNLNSQLSGVSKLQSNLLSGLSTMLKSLATKTA